MKTMCLMAMGLCLAYGDTWAQEEDRPAPRLSKEAIAKAVRETLAESPGDTAETRGKARDGTLSGDAYQKFSRDFSEARKPSCMGPDATRFQPHEWTIKTPGGGWHFGLGGVFAAPFWAAAILRGKCQ